MVDEKLRFKGGYYINLLYLVLTQELEFKVFKFKMGRCSIKDKKMIGLGNLLKKWSKDFFNSLTVLHG